MLRFITALCSSLVLVRALNTEEIVSLSEADPNCTQKLNGDGTITVYYDQDTELVNMKATIPSGSYAGFGWGESMTNTEMVIFSTTGGTGAMKTYISSGNQPLDAKPTL